MVANLRVQLTTVEVKLERSPKDYLEFGTTDKDKQFRKVEFATRYVYGKPVDLKTYYGEVNSNKQPHGRNIVLDVKGNVFFGLFANGQAAPGKFLNVYVDGRFEAGRYYNDPSTGILMQSGTRYFMNGSSERFDY